MYPHIEQAIQTFRVNSVRHAKAERYYPDDDLSFATEKFLSAFGVLFRQVVLNLCPAICDAVRDKLEVTGLAGTVKAPFRGSIFEGRYKIFVTNRTIAGY